MRPPPTPTVLIVDDHPVVREGLRRLILNQGVYVVGEAGTGQEGLRLAQDLQPDLIIWDLAMPGGGLGRLAELKTASPDSKVLVITVLDVAEVAGEAERAGADGIVSKGAPPEELVQALHTVLRGRRAFPKVSHLSPREEQIMVLLAEGLGNKEIAERLGVSTKTVESHLDNLKAKLGCTSTADLRARALRRR